MITIKLHNSYSQITDFSQEVYRRLKKRLSYEQNPGSGYFSGGIPRRVSLINKRGFFPTGLLEELMEELDQKGVEYRFEDKRKILKQKGSYEVTNEYSWQIEALKAVQEFSRGIITATTGAGKSRVIRNICHQVGVPTLIVVPSLEIKNQLVEDLKDVKNAIVENIDSKALNKPSKAGCLIIDEAHHVAAKTYQILNKTVWKDIYFRYFLTATPFRNQKNEQMMFKGVAGDVIYELTYTEAVKSNCVVPVKAYSVDLPDKRALKNGGVQGYSWPEVYSELVTKNTLRNHIIANYLTKLSTAGKKTICIVKEVAHGKLLSEWSGQLFVHGQDEESRKYIQAFKKGEINVLIGTAGILGEGVDTRPAEYIIVAGLGKAKSAFMQQVGRGVRTYPGKESCKVILFNDPSHKWTRAHYKIQKQILIDEFDAPPVSLKL